MQIILTESGKYFIADYTTYTAGNSWCDSIPAAEKALLTNYSREEHSVFSQIKDYTIHNILIDGKSVTLAEAKQLYPEYFI